MSNGDREGQDEAKERGHHLPRREAAALPHEDNESHEHERDDVDHRCAFNEHLPWTEQIHARTGPIHFSGPFLWFFRRQIITPAAPPTLAAVAPKPPWF